MQKTVCSSCGRIQLGTENGPDNRISHDFCAKCLLGRTDTIGASPSELLDPALKNDPRVMEAREFAKESVQVERNNNVTWIDNGQKYPEEIERLYDVLAEEINREATAESGSEIRRK
jgi:hypothetical protein